MDFSAVLPLWLQWFPAMVLNPTISRRSYESFPSFLCFFSRFYSWLCLVCFLFICCPRWPAFLCSLLPVGPNLPLYSLSSSFFFLFPPFFSPFLLTFSYFSPCCTPSPFFFQWACFSFLFSVSIFPYVFVDLDYLLSGSFFSRSSLSSPMTVSTCFVLSDSSCRGCDPTPTLGKIHIRTRPRQLETPPTCPGPSASSFSLRVRKFLGVHHVRPQCAGPGKFLSSLAFSFYLLRPSSCRSFLYLPSPAFLSPQPSSKGPISVPRSPLVPFFLQSCRSWVVKVLTESYFPHCVNFALSSSVKAARVF